MNFLFFVASVALLSITVAINADMYGPELGRGFRMALDQFVQVHLDKSLHSDERATQLRALAHPLFVYADENKDGFVFKGEFRPFLGKVIPYVLPQFLDHLPEKERLEIHEYMNEGFPDFVEKAFAQSDADGNGMLSLQEVTRGMADGTNRWQLQMAVKEEIFE